MGCKMAKKKKYYVINSPKFQGIVETIKEYNKHVLNKKGTFGKGFTSYEDAMTYLTQLQQNNGKPKQKQIKYYAIYGPLFTGIVYSKSEFEKYVVGQKKMHGRQVKSEVEGEEWIRKHSKKPETIKMNANKGGIVKDSIEENKQAKYATTNNSLINVKEEKLFVNEDNMSKQCVLYIDGSFKDGVGKYGVLVFTSTWQQPILKDFGYVYDDEFNELHNTGAELMACLRGLEWALANGMKKIVVVYDFEGIIHLQKSMSEKRAVQIFTNMMVRFRHVMDIQFIHVRHSNRELHNEVHKLTQLNI